MMEDISQENVRYHGEDTSSADSSSTNSLTPSLPDNTKPSSKSAKVSGDVYSDGDSGSISEHISSEGSSVERDRSFQEIEITNIPLNILCTEEEEGGDINISPKNEREYSPERSEYSSSKIDHKSPPDCAKNVQSILEEILNNELFKSDSEDRTVVDSSDVSLNIFAHVDLDDKSLTNYGKNKNIADLSLDVRNNCKDSDDVLVTNTNVSNKEPNPATVSEFDSSKEFLSNPSTSSTEYKAYQEELQNKLVEYHSAMAHKDDLIQQLTESLQESIASREDLKGQSEYLKQEILQLQKQLEETSQVLKQHVCFSESTEKMQMAHVQHSVQGETNLKNEVAQCHSISDIFDCSNFEKGLSVAQLNIFVKFKEAVDKHLVEIIENSKKYYEDEIEKLKATYVQENDDYKSEINRLQDVLASVKCSLSEMMDMKQELELKHAKEVEELRTYFEKKCADLEKNYSEEIFSQQSRKVSGSSLDSDAGLMSDLFMSGGQPGPAGDMMNFDIANIDPNKRDLSGITKSEVIRLKDSLSQLLKSLENYNVDRLTDEDLDKMKSEMASYDLRSLARYDLAEMKKDMQNKYHAELEILREDCENRVDMANVRCEEKIKNLETKYLEEIEVLRDQLNKSTNAHPILSSTVQEVASLNDFEINEVVQSYERRLQEQVTLAKIDIIAALEAQIQRLAANEGDDEEWPSELLQLRDRFTERYEKQITQMTIDHQNEIAQLKEEHLKNLNATIDRARRRSLRDSDSWNREELELIKERDILKKQVSGFRTLLSELLKYFTQCEDELNNTLVGELFKLGCEKHLQAEEIKLNSSDNGSSTADSLTNIKRVHLAPNFTDILNIIDDSIIEEADSKDVSFDFKSELDYCLEKLRSEANAILALTMNVKKPSEITKTNSDGKLHLEDKVTSLTRQLINETQQKNELNSRLQESEAIIRTLESERATLEDQLEDVIIKQKSLEDELVKAKKRITDLIESGHKEIVSEGYGEEGKINIESSGNMSASLARFQETARNLMNESTMLPDQSLAQLIEEFCRMGEKVGESARLEREEFIQQINVADKKYKTTCKFLEEQAVEREQERDEAQREIDSLREQLRSRDRDRVSCERINSEVVEFINAHVHTYWNVEDLEKQVKELTNLIEEYEVKLKESDAERRDAVEKIYVLRDIIRDLESQIETRANREKELRDVIQELESIVKHQTESNSELHQHIDSCQNISDVQALQQHIAHLETELQNLRLNAELVGSEGTIKQINNELQQLETTLEKRTRDLEGLHCVTPVNSCSSPSEDVSVRDLINSKNPTMSLDECQIPLQQLERLKEKLTRHSRAEDAAIKRIKDLEMQIFGLKNEVEESQNEREILKKQISEQLVLISSLQIRLDEQRIRAEHMEKQTNTSLELKIYDLQNEIDTLEEKIRNRDKTITQLNAVLEETRQHLKKKEEEELSASKPEGELIVSMQREIESLRRENEKLTVKMNSEAHIVPNLVENIISDKNNDIEKLREKLAETEGQLEMYNSLNLDKSHVSIINKLKSSGISLENVLSLLDASGPEQALRVKENQESLSLSAVFPTKANETDFLNATSLPSEISRIEKVAQLPSLRLHSTEISRPTEKRVHFEDTVIESLKCEIEDLKVQLASKDELLKEYTERLKVLGALERNMENLQVNLEKTEQALKNATATFEKEQSELKEAEKNLRVELAEKKLHLSERDKQLEVYKQDSQRKDEMYIKLAKEKRELEKQFAKFSEEMDKNTEIDTLKRQLERLPELENIVELLEKQAREKEYLAETLKTDLEMMKSEHVKLSKELEDMKTAHEKLTKDLASECDLTSKLKKDLENKSVMINSLEKTVADLQRDIESKEEAIASLKETIKDQQTSLETYKELDMKQKDLLVDRNCEIEILNEDLKRYQDDITELEKKLDHSKKEKNENKDIAEKDVEIANKKKQCEDLSKELIHLQDLLNEKDKIIDQMSKDSKALHVNLETIQSKMQETGNIIDLGRRLRDEQKKNASLLEEIHLLKAQLLAHESARRNSDMVTSIEEITGKVRRELDYSAHLDSSIISAVNEHNLTSLENVDVENLKQALVRERSLSKELEKSRDHYQQELHEMEQKYENAKRQIDKLNNQLEKERLNLNEVQLEDAKLIEQMRLRLDSALDNEMEYEKLLEAEKQLRFEAEKQLSNLKQKLSSTSSNSKTEMTEYKSLPSKENKLEKHLAVVKEENLHLSKQLKSLKQSKNEVDTNLKYAKDMLSLKEDEIKTLEKKLENMRQNELAMREDLVRSKAELEQKLHEAENTRILLEEIDQERAGLQTQVAVLNRKLQNALLATENKSASTAIVPDDLHRKIQELNDAVRSNKEMMHLIEQLNAEKLKLQEELNEIQARPEKVFGDPLARANYLFAKYLRSESYRKALIWQKSYLTSLLVTYQEYNLPQQLEQFSLKAHVTRRKKISFKCTALALMAISRMKYLVVRWHTGKRVAAKINSAHFDSTSADHPPSRFRLGHPVSNQHFSTSTVLDREHELFQEYSSNLNNKQQHSHPTDSDAPWSGKTPPSKDTKSLHHSHFRQEPGIPDRPPLRAPELLTSYFERFNQIQERLGMALKTNSKV